jgi:hypothetical protein
MAPVAQMVPIAITAANLKNFFMVRSQAPSKPSAQSCLAAVLNQKPRPCP